MNTLKSFLTGKYVLWLLLALPGILSTKNYLAGSLNYAMMMHITGEFAGRFLVISLIATPLALLFPKSQVSKWLIRNRRFFGVGAFAYTLLHTIFYVLKYPFGQLVSEFATLSILTGWIAFFIFIPLAMTSTDAAIKRMGPAWKKLQRWVYLAAVMAFAHWALLGLQGEHASMGGALFHFVPVVLLQLYRVWKESRTLRRS
ncbi:MAG: sulfite oxidase heme-binding subunit YedZ [Saprospiraceae bacterium]